MSILNSKFLTPFLVVLLGWMLFATVSIEVKKNEIKKKEANIKSEIADIERNNSSLERDIKNFENPAFLEKEARLRLNYKAPDENVVFVYLDTNEHKSSSAEEFSPKHLSDYRKWWRWLLGY